MGPRLLYESPVNMFAFDVFDASAWTKKSTNDKLNVARLDELFLGSWPNGWRLCRCGWREEQANQSLK